MSTRTVTLHNTGGATIATLVVRDSDASTGTPTRNYDPVQPPGSTIQGTFGDGLHNVGVLERDFAMCDVSAYASVLLAKAALETAFLTTASVRVDGWSLPIAAVAGITEWQYLLVGFRARIRFIPSSADWTLVSDGVTTVTGVL